MKTSVLGFLTLLLVPQMFVHAGDVAREKRMAAEIVDAILDGDAVYLMAAEHEFLTIYTEAEEAQGTVIILHGRGFHPDWQDAIKPMRVGLAEGGWNTLSVQMPVLEKQAKYYDYIPIFNEAYPRIDAAIEFAKEQNSKKIVLVAHSCGAHMAMSWLENKNRNAESVNIDAYVGLGMGATDYKQPMREGFPLDTLNVPILDIYADEDYPAVIKMSAERMRLIKAAGNKKSKQLVIKNSQHYYADRGDELTAAIQTWLNSL